MKTENNGMRDRKYFGLTNAFLLLGSIVIIISLRVMTMVLIGFPIDNYWPLKIFLYLLIIINAILFAVDLYFNVIRKR